DQRNALSSKVDARLRPSRRVVPGPLEVLQAPEVRHTRRRQISACHDAIACGQALTLVGLQPPEICRLVKGLRDDLGIELDVRPEVEFVCDEIEVAEDIGLNGISVRPAPFLLQFVREAVRIFQALDVASRAGIAIPEPGSSNTASGLVNPNTQPEPAQA